MIKSNPKTVVAHINEDTMSVGELEENADDLNERSALLHNDLVITKPFNNWRECRKSTMRDYSDILMVLSKHVDIKQINQVKHMLMLVIPSVLKPIESEQNKLQTKYLRIYRFDHIKTRIKDTKVSLVGIVKEIIKVSYSFIILYRKEQALVTNYEKWKLQL
jgi:hypothetical protein